MTIDNVLLPFVRREAKRRSADFAALSALRLRPPPPDSRTPAASVPAAVGHRRQSRVLHRARPQRPGAELRFATNIAKLAELVRRL